MAQNKVTLAGAWVPRGELERLRRYLPRLHEIYADMVIVIPATEPNHEAEIRDLPGVHVHYTTVAGEGRWLSLKLALESDAEYIHYMDVDRLIRWVELRPDELQQAVEAISKTDLLLIGRTEKAFATHPKSMQQTERLVHITIGHLIGMGEVDVCAGSKGLNRLAAELIASRGNLSHNIGTEDGEWPVLAHRAGLSIHTMLVDGLDWETADRYRDTAADETLQRELAAQHDADVTQWQARTQLALNIIQAAMELL